MRLRIGLQEVYGTYRVDISSLQENRDARVSAAGASHA